MDYKIYVQYNNKRVPLYEAIKSIGMEPLSAMGRIREYIKKNNSTFQEEFEKLVKRNKRRLERKKYIEEIYSQVKDKGVSKECIKHRIYKNFSKEKIAYQGSLKIFNGAKPNNSYKVIYNNEILGFKTAIRKATNNISLVNYSALRRCKIYEGLTPQETFDLFIKRWRIKWGLQ